MRRAVRVGLVVLGAAMAAYGAASLTGGWLGTPPWWHQIEKRYDEEYARRTWQFPEIRDEDAVYLIRRRVPRGGREWISGGVVAAGIALVAVGAWPRRRAGASS
jgi:hypothetical protein